MVQTPSKSKRLSFELPDDLSLKVTQAQFEMLAVANRELKLERTAEGELIVNPPTGWETGERNFSLAVEFGIWLKRHDVRGKAFDSSTGFILPNGATRSPDLSWVSQNRWDALNPEQRKTFANVCPEFVIELRSSSDPLKPLQGKLREYIENGAKLGWLIDPKSKRVEVYRAGKAVEVLEAPTEISGEGMLSGFVLKMRTIWT